ncbi:hypothetical protein [Yersinia intermedia]|uniref:hypothetical protein n=1 Tax=Yersinia intermedia TaxID=631 RepID=UPI000B73B5B2|nr:hypothetical protein [Yersinia intermedia]MCW8114242.1 hypothetical protein [Yersinia intermedia]MDA5519004.1 hypothetical protein [Yersinia intermedia]OWF86381.1 hypothetical protein B4916_22825 [Yersinia intermedia]
MKKLLILILILVPALVLLAACNDKPGVETVRSLTLPAHNNQTLGAVLDARPACEKTTWTLTQGEGDTVGVEYQCDFSATQTQTLFKTQISTWTDRYQRRLADSKKALDILQDEKMQATTRIGTARQVFEQLQGSGDLDRYKALVSGSPADNLSLDAAHAYFISDAGVAYLVSKSAPAPQSDTQRTVAAVDAVYQTIASAGLETETLSGDACQSPAALMLTIGASVPQIEQAFSDCLTGVETQYTAAVAVAGKKVEAATAGLGRVSKALTLLNIQEVIHWSLPADGQPQPVSRTFTLNARDATDRRVTKTLGVTDEALASVYDGQFSRVYQDLLVSAMSDLVR